VNIIGYTQQISSESNYDIEFDLLNIIPSRKPHVIDFIKDIQLQIVNVTVLHITQDAEHAKIYIV